MASAFQLLNLFGIFWGIFFVEAFGQVEHVVLPKFWEFLMTWCPDVGLTSLLPCSLYWLVLLLAGIGHSTKRNAFLQMVTFFDLIIISLNIGLACSYQKAHTAGFMVYGPQLRIVILIQMTTHLNKSQWTGSLPPSILMSRAWPFAICLTYQQSSGQG